MTGNPMPPDIEGDIMSAEDFGCGLRDATAALSRSARRLAGNDADGEDLVQDTLVRAWAARKRFQAGSNLRAWLFRIQRNLFLSGRRRAWRNVQWDSETIERTLIDAPRQETAFLLGEAYSMIDALPAHQVDAFRLVALEGQSYEDAAQTLGVGLNTVKSRVSRARAYLSRLLDGEVRAAAPPPERFQQSSTYAEWKNSGLRLIG